MLSRGNESTDDARGWKTMLKELGGIVNLNATVREFITTPAHSHEEMRFGGIGFEFGAQAADQFFDAGVVHFVDVFLPPDRFDNLVFVADFFEPPIHQQE